MQKIKSRVSVPFDEYVTQDERNLLREEAAKNIGLYLLDNAFIKWNSELLKPKVDRNI